MTFQIIRIFWTFFDVTARHKIFSILLVGILAYIGCMFVSNSNGIPPAFVHDENSYLLAADTFSKGRLTNPTHPMWEHFESFHIIHNPSYMSKYPPMQGLILALGKIISGRAIVGVWLSMALMCAAVTWMLQGWTSPRWALIGGLFALGHVKFGIFSYWGNSYLGSTIAVCGAALFFGSFRRIFKHPSVKNALLIGAGIFILANSRPWEGLTVILPGCLVLLIWIISGIVSGKTRTEITIKIFIPLILIAFIGGSFMLYYNYRITGNSFKMPYKVHQETYSITPSFVWQNADTQPEYNHKTMAKFYYKYQTQRLTRHANLASSISNSFKEIIFIKKMLFYNLVLLALGLSSILLLGRNKWMGFVYLSTLSFLAGNALSTFFNPHYTAPMIPLFCIMIAQGARTMNIIRIGRTYPGKYLLPLLILFSLFSFIAGILHFLPFQEKNNNLFSHMNYKVRKILDKSIKERSKIEAMLNAKGGEHIVIVKYGPLHNVHAEWVYNAADIASSPIIWARDMGAKRNSELISYFPGRQYWITEISNDHKEVKIKPYKAKF